MANSDRIVQVNIGVTPKVHGRLAAAAEAKGMPKSTYAKLLFEAAYAARIGQERGDPPVDGELDDQVRLVFACAGQGNTAAIAKAIGIPEARVVKILDGWKLALGPARKGRAA